MAVTAILRIVLTLAMAAAAVFVGWRLWNFYTLSPWTRDAFVQATVVQVAPDVSGLITSINVLDNQKVAKGDVLFALDQQRFTLAVNQAQAAVEQSQWSLKLAQDNANRDAEVLKGDPGAISPATTEASRTRANEAEAALQLAQAQLATAQLNLERSTVHSPVNGFIANLTAGAGDYATAGNSVLALVDSDSFYVYAYFMETKIPSIDVGSDAEIRLMAGGRILSGKVQGISRAIANPTAVGAGLLATVDPNFEWIRLAQRIPVRITLEDLPDDIELAAGMSATVVVRSPSPAN